MSHGSDKIYDKILEEGIVEATQYYHSIIGATSVNSE